MTKFDFLAQQILEKPFRGMLFSIYNLAEEERYLNGLEKLGYDTDIDSLEFITLERYDSFLNEIISFKDLLQFKKKVESDIQSDKVVVGILLYHSSKGYVPVVVKPKSFDITTIFAVQENGCVQES